MTDDTASAEAPGTEANTETNLDPASARIPDPFVDLAGYIAIPRVSGLALSPDGERLVTGVQRLSADGKKYVSSVWEVDRAGGAPVRLTRSQAGESTAAFLPDGSLLFAAKRPDPDGGKDGDDGGRGLWLLPARGGEARLLVAPAAGVGDVAVAAGGGAVVFSARLMPGAADFDEDAARRKARKDANVTAILHTGPRIRHWDEQLGPDTERLFLLDLSGAAAADAAEGPGGSEPKPTVRQISADLGHGLRSFAVTADGSQLLYDLEIELPGADYTGQIRRLDIATGADTLFAGDQPEVEFFSPVISPDDSTVAYLYAALDSYEHAPKPTIRIRPLADTDPAAGRDLAADLDLWPSGLTWSADSATLYFTADELGACPVFRLDVATGEVTRLTGDRGSYGDLQPAPDGSALYAMRTAVDAVPQPVRLDPAVADQTPVRLPVPGADVELPGRLEELTVTAEDGVVIHSRLVLPHGASAENPVPLVVQIHGGPLMSSNAWGWRANPWVMAAKGFAVLMPDYSLSTGYGQAFVDRGKGENSGTPFSDIMAATDAAVARPDIDGTRTAAMGGSFGGYLTNWIATQTDRFRALVSHAGVWNAQLRTVSDGPSYFRRAYGDVLGEPEKALRWSPHLHADKVSTPMLVIHGNRDYRVPIANALWQWQDLTRLGKDAKFLYFPDENHWILRPQESKLWFETVRAFLSHHVLGEEWEPSELL